MSGHPARKSNGKVRLCVDFKRINAITRLLPFYIPRIEEVLEAVGKVKVISKLDLSKGYSLPGTHEGTTCCQDCFHLPQGQI